MDFFVFDRLPMGREIIFDLCGMSHRKFRDAVQRMYPTEAILGQTDIKLPLHLPQALVLAENPVIIRINNPTYGVHGLSAYRCCIQSVRLEVYTQLKLLIDALEPGPKLIICDLYGFSEGHTPSQGKPDYRKYGDSLTDFVYSKTSDINDGNTIRASERRLGRMEHY